MKCDKCGTQWDAPVNDCPVCQEKQFGHFASTSSEADRSDTTVAPKAMSLCDWCGWAIKPTIEEGCTADSCSMRPMPRLEGTDLFEVKRYARKLEQDRAELIDDLRWFRGACQNEMWTDENLRRTIIKRVAARLEKLK